MGGWSVVLLFFLTVGCCLQVVALNSTNVMNATLTTNTKMSSEIYLEALMNAKAHREKVNQLNGTMFEYINEVEAQLKQVDHEMKIINLGETNNRNMYAFKQTLQRRQSFFHSLKETKCMNKIAQEKWNSLEQRFVKNLTTLQEAFKSPYFAREKMNSTSIRKNKVSISREVRGKFISERTFICLGDQYGMYIDLSSGQLMSFGYEYSLTVPLGRPGSPPTIEPAAVNLGLVDGEFIKQLVCGKVHAMVLTNKRIIGWVGCQYFISI